MPASHFTVYKQDIIKALVRGLGYVQVKTALWICPENPAESRFGSVKICSGSVTSQTFKLILPSHVVKSVVNGPLIGEETHPRSLILWDKRTSISNG